MNLKEKQIAMKNAAIEFSNGKSIKEVMSKYNVSYASVYNTIKKLNIDYEYTYGRKHNLNEYFFEDIDTEEKAYWLGFIMADGAILKTSKQCLSHNRVKLAVSLKDEDHLEKFKKSIESTSEIKYYKSKSGSKNYSGENYIHAYINIDSIKMVSDLIDLGCTPNKTDFLKIPKIPKNLMKHFIRGYFDGDGSISTYKQKGREDLRCEFAITSNSEILLEIQNELINNCNLNKTKLKPYKRTTKATSLRYGGKNQVMRIFDYLYSDATIFLKRKYDKFIQLFS